MTDLPRCTERVWNKGSFRPHKCLNTAKHDPVDGVPQKCGTHSNAAKERRKKKSDESFKMWQRLDDAKNNLNQAVNGLEKIVRRIAEGHNDPQGLATETIEYLDYCRETYKDIKILQEVLK